MDDRTVTGRLVALLDAVAGCGEPVTLADLTRLTGIPKPTVRRIAAGLVTRRLLERVAGGYRLGTHLVDLGVRAAAQHGLRDAAIPYLHDLLARTGEVVWITAFTDSTVVFVDCAFGTNRAPDVRRSGWPMDLYSAAFLYSAAGRVLLADRPDLSERLRARPLPGVTARTITSWPLLAAALDSVRDTGIAIEHEQSALGYSCIASGLRTPDGTLVGILGITGRTGSLTPHRLTRPLMAATTDIAHSLAPATPGS